MELHWEEYSAAVITPYGWDHGLEVWWSVFESWLYHWPTLLSRAGEVISMYLGFPSVKWGDNNCVRSCCCPDSHISPLILAMSAVGHCWLHPFISLRAIKALLFSFLPWESCLALWVNAWPVGHGHQWINAPASCLSAGQLWEASFYFSGGQAAWVPIVHHGVWLMQPFIDSSSCSVGLSLSSFMPSRITSPKPTTLSPYLKLCFQGNPIVYLMG